jgi:hypothetical protein
MTAEVTEFAQYPDVCSLYDPDVDGAGDVAAAGPAHTGYALKLKQQPYDVPTVLLLKRHG